MEITYAIVETSTGNIVNRTLWDGAKPWSPGDGLTAVPDPENVSVIGGTWTEEGGFAPPEE